MVVTLKRQQDKKREHVFYISGRNSGARPNGSSGRWWGKLLRTQAAEFWEFGCGFGVSQFFQGVSMLFLNQLLTSSSIRHGTCYVFLNNPGHNNILVHKLGALMPPRSVANSNQAPRAYHSRCASAEQSTVNYSTLAGSR